MPTKVIKLNVIHPPAPPVPAVKKVVLALPNLAATLARQTGAPPAAATAAVRKVVTLHLAHPVASSAAQADLASLTSPAAQDLAGAAHAMLVQSPDFWVAYYANQAEVTPLPVGHPWAGIIARDLMMFLEGGTQTAGRAPQVPVIDPDNAQGGIDGWGARYLRDEQDVLEQAPSPANRSHWIRQ